MQHDITPVISVVIPTRPGGGQLARAIDSVLRQSEPRFELIVVTDCGATAEEGAEHLKRDDPRVRYVDLLNKTGANAARNLGSSLCQSDIVTYLDADDEYLPDALASRYALLGQHDTAGFVVTSHYSIARNRTSRKINRSWFPPTRGLERHILGSSMHISSTALAVRRSSLEHIGGWNENLARMQDRDVLLRLNQVVPGIVSAEADFRKIETPGSISSFNHNYMESYSAFLRENSELVKPYRNLIGYRVTCRLAVLLFERNFNQFIHAYRQNTALPELGFSQFELVYCYVSGLISLRSGNGR